MVNKKTLKSKQTIASIILLGLLMASMFLMQAPPATAQVDTHGGPPGGGYEGPNSCSFRSNS